MTPSRAKTLRLSERTVSGNKAISALRRTDTKSGLPEMAASRLNYRRFGERLRIRFDAVRTGVRRFCEALMVSSTFIFVPQLEHTRRFRRCYAVSGYRE
jgi:hypothetical protein